jgi:4-hydroxy-2-oxoheptanedioate aldolase
MGAFGYGPMMLHEEMKLPENIFKTALAKQTRQLGLWIALGDAYCAEICAGAGFDWLLIDGEHAPNDVRSILAQLQAVAAYPVHAVVRPPAGDVALIKQLLDIGAQSLLIPMVETADQARLLVSAVRYPPRGIRGVGSALARSSQWNGIKSYLDTADDQICLLVQIETRRGLDNLEAIAAVEGVDGLFIGPADLSASLGHRGNPDHLDVQTAINSAIGRIGKQAKPPEFSRPMTSLSGNTWNWDVSSSLSAPTLLSSAVRRATLRRSSNSGTSVTISNMRFAVFLFLPFIASAQLVTPTSIPNGAIPVVFLNGYQLGCTGDTGFSSNFGNADKVLQASGLVSVFFDNCSVSGGPSIETLGTAFGNLLASLRYVNGAAVPLVDVVGHSMGGLIVRSYLSGKQPVAAGAAATFNPPATPGIRNAVFLATPHFGTAVAGFLGSDTQTREMSLGSQFLFDLNTWNQGTDDLRGVNALALAGNAGTGLESSLTGSPSPGFDDGIVQLTSASIGFALPGRTRVVPTCHATDPLVVTDGVCLASTTAINNIADTNNLVGQIMTSFLTGTTAWTTLGQAIEANALASANGGLLLEAQDLNGLQQNITSATASGTALGTNAVAYKEALSATATLQLAANLLGSVSAATSTKLNAGTSPVVAKPGPSISGIVPAGIAQFPRSVAPGAFVTVYGSNLSSSVLQSGQPYPTQLGDVSVIVNGTAAQVAFASTSQINFIYPNLPPGLAKLTVKNSTGQQTVNVMLAPAVPSIFTFTTTDNGPAQAENAVTFAVVGPNLPLHAGDYVALYLTGIGLTPATTTVTIGGQSCTGAFFFAGHTSQYQGVDLVQCQIPAGVTGAAVPAVITTNGIASNAATLNIQ